jgi:predicted ATPase
MVAVPYDSTRAFGLFQNYARRMFGVELEDGAQAIDQKVHARLDPLNQAAPEAIGLCSIAIQRVITAAALDDTFGFSSQAVKNDIKELMFPAFRESCKLGPVVVVVDDMQWADPASVDLLIHLLSLTDEVPILMLCAFRPERQSPAWQLKLKAETDFPHRYLELPLMPLSAGDTETLVTSLLRIRDLPDDVRQLILRKADGNPYFTEEIVRSLVEQGVIEEIEGNRHWRPGAKVADVAIPDSLQALLMARIDRLDAEAKSTLQMASVIGRSFYYSILQAISDSAMALDKDLRSLERVELLREAGRQPELEYIFRHELARDAAYATILNRKRREFHRRVAEAMEMIFADRIESQAHRLAQHFELAQDDDRALRYYEIAATAAMNLGATPEATRHYTSAIDAARRLGREGDVLRISASQAALDLNGATV